MALRKGRISRPYHDELLANFRRLRIKVETMPMAHYWERPIDLATQHKLTVYDASYLDLAIRSGLPLATLDDALIVAARAEGVPVLP